jgi:hypothetical protein
MEWSNELSFLYIGKLHQPILIAHEPLNYLYAIKNNWWVTSQTQQFSTLTWKPSRTYLHLVGKTIHLSCLTHCHKVAPMQTLLHLHNNPHKAAIAPPSTSCRHVTTTLCPLQHASFMQITWTVPLTSSFSHTTATWHAQHMYSSLASLAFSAAALNLHVDHLGSAYGRLITSLKALLHSHHHAEAIWCTHCTLACRFTWVG